MLPAVDDLAALRKDIRVLRLRIRSIEAILFLAGFGVLIWLPR